ncbi:MAG: FAD-dependent oxidoreductase [Cyanobacteria bacterium J06639_18]
MRSNENIGLDMKEKLTLIQGANILVIGAGVSGLTTAISLKKAGFNVTIAADSFAPDLTSVVAGALWEWPPAVCGHHGAPRSLERSKEWCMTSYEKFKEMHADFGSESTGIYLRDVYFYFKDVLENQPFDLNKMNELKDKVDGFERGLQIVKDSIDLNFQGGIKDAYKHMSPMVNTDVYMKWLLKHVQEIGCEIVKEKITVNVVENEQELLRRFNAKAIVNCAGLGSIVTTGDSSMHPLRGALVRVKNKGGVVKDAHCISHDRSSTDEQDIIFIVPRGDDLVVLGGLAQPDKWSTKLSLDIPIIRQMYDGCLQFLEELRDLPLDEQEPVRTGLRPCTKKNVCLERVPNTKIFYNYGHGGSGVTLSWGCSKEIVELVQTALCEEVDKSISLNNQIDINQKTVFVLHDMLSAKTDFSSIKSDKRNLVLLCSRRGLSKVVPSQYQHFGLVRIIEPFNLENIIQTYQQIKADYGLKDSNCQIVTNDGYLTLLTAKLRETLNLTHGDRQAVVSQFTNKSSLKSALKNSSIKLPKHLIFDRNQYSKEPVSYLNFVVRELGDNIFIKSVNRNEGEQIRRVHTVDELKAWCESNINSVQEFELNELVRGQPYTTTIAVEDGKPKYFAACKYNRFNDKFLYGNSISSIIIREEESEFQKLKQFSIEVLQNLEHSYPRNGVVNINLFLPEDGEEPLIMEINLGSPGTCASKMFEKYQGIKLNELHLQLQIGDSPNIQVKDKKDWKYSAYSIHPKRDGVVTAIEQPIFESDVEISWHIYVGGAIKASQSMSDVGIAILLSHDDYSILEKDLEIANNATLYKTEKNFLNKPEAEKSEVRKTELEKPELEKPELEKSNVEIPTVQTSGIERFQRKLLNTVGNFLNIK